MFEIAPAFRAEPSATTRHVSEVTMLDIEMGFIKNHDDVLSLVQDMLYEVVTKSTEYSKTFKSMNIQPTIITKEFPRFKVAEIHRLFTKLLEKILLMKILCQNGYVIMQKINMVQAVFATSFPASAMKFYHAIIREDPDTVLWGRFTF